MTFLHSQGHPLFKLVAASALTQPLITYYRSIKRVNWKWLLLVFSGQVFLTQTLTLGYVLNPPFRRFCSSLTSENCNTRISLGGFPLLCECIFWFSALKMLRKAENADRSLRREGISVWDTGCREAWKVKQRVDVTRIRKPSTFQRDTRCCCWWYGSGCCWGKV